MKSVRRSSLVILRHEISITVLLQPEVPEAHSPLGGWLNFKVQDSDTGIQSIVSYIEPDIFSHTIYIGKI